MINIGDRIRVDKGNHRGFEGRIKSINYDNFIYSYVYDIILDGNGNIIKCSLNDFVVIDAMTSRLNNHAFVIPKGSYFENEYKMEYSSMINPHMQSKKCTCGIWKTYGEDCDLSFHSLYCDLLVVK